MHGTSTLDIAGEWHAAQHSADGLQRALGGLVQERRDLLGVAGDQQKPLAALREAGELAAVVGRLRDHVAVRTQELANLVEQVPAARGNAGHVLEQDHFDRVTLVRLEHQPDPAQGEAIEGLVLVGAALALRHQPGEALARRAQEDDVRALVAEGRMHVRRGRLAPACRRLAAVEGAVLVAIKQVQHRAAGAADAIEITNGCRVDIDAADAAERGLRGAYVGARLVEAGGTAAESAEQVGVADLEFSHSRRPPGPSTCAATRAAGPCARWRSA